MHIIKKKHLRWLSFLVAWFVVFSTLVPFTPTAKAAKNENAKQTLEFPIVPPQEQEKDKPSISKNLAGGGGTSGGGGGGSYESPTTTYSAIRVYYNSYINYNLTDGLPVRATIYNLTEEQRENLSFALSIEKDGKVVATLDESDTEHFKKKIEYGTVHLLGYFFDLKEDGYTVKLEIYEDQSKVISTTPQALSLHLDGPAIDRKYYSVKSHDFYLNLRGISKEVGQALQGTTSQALSLELIDNQGNTVAKSHAGWSGTPSIWGYTSTLYPFEDTYGSYSVSGNVFQSDAMPAGEYGVVVKKNGEKVDLKHPVKISLTDNPIIDGLSTYWNTSFVPGTRSFQVQLYGANLSSKDLFSISLKDSEGQIVATSEKSSYLGIYDDGHANLLYQMKVLEDKAIVAGEHYSLSLSYSGPGTLISNIEKATFSPNPYPSIVNVDSSLAHLGRIRVKTINLEKGKTYPAELHTYSTTSSAISAETISSEASLDDAGVLTYDFKDKDGHPLRITGYNSLRILLPDTSSISQSFNAGGYANGEISYVDPTTLPVDVKTYKAHLEVRNTKIDPAKLSIKLAEAAHPENIVGQMKTQDLHIEPLDWDPKGLSIDVEMEITGTLEPNKAYRYVVENDGHVLNSYQPVHAIDQPRIDDPSIEESRTYYSYGYYPSQGYSPYPGYYQSFNYISTAETAFHFVIPNAINIGDDSKLSIYLEDKQSNIVADVKEKEVIEKGIFKDYKGILEPTEALEKGNYTLVVKYDNEILAEKAYILTDEAMAETYYVPDKISPDASSLRRVYLKDTLNIQPEKLSVSLKDLNGNVIKSILDPTKTNVYDGGDIELFISFEAPLKEGYYTLEILHDGKPIHFSDRYLDSNRILVTKEPSLIGSSYWIEENTVYYTLNTTNLDASKKYKLSFYKESYSSDEAASRYAGTINLPPLSPEGNFELTSEDLAAIPAGDYRIFLEAEDKVISSYWMYVYKPQDEAPTQEKEPAFSINNGASYTHNKEVALQITPERYTYMKTSNEEASLQTATYEIADASKKWTLSDGDGEKTVYMQFKDEEGKESSVISSKILLDTQAPEAPKDVTLSKNDFIEVNQWLSILASGSDKAVKAYATFSKHDTVTNTDTAIKTYDLYYRGKNDSDYLFGSSVQISKDLKDATSIKVYFKDFAGNVSAEKKVDFKIGNLSTLSGTLKNDKNETFPYHGIALQKKDGSPYRWAQTNQNGEYKFENVPNGEYQLYVYGTKRYKDIQKSIEVKDYTDLTEDLVFEKKYAVTSNLSVTVKDAAGNPVKDAWIYVNNWNIGEYANAQTDAAGASTFSDLPSKEDTGLTYGVSIYHNGYSEWKEITLKKEGDSVAFTVPEMGTLKGTVKDSKGAVVSGVGISAQGTNGQYAWAKTDDKGEYTLSVQKGQNTTYKVTPYVSNVLNKVTLENHSAVSPDSENIDFTLYPGVRVYGSIKDDAGNPIDARVYSYSSGGYEWHNTSSNKTDGSFDFGKAFGIGTHQIYHNWVEGFYSDNETIEITADDVKTTSQAIKVDLKLKSFNASDVFTGEKNNVKTNVSFIQKGKDIAVKVNYHNASDRTVDTVTITAAIPEGTSLVEGSGSLTKTVEKLRSGESGELSFLLHVSDSYKENKVVISAKASFEQKEAVLGFAEVSIVNVTLNGPAEAATGQNIKVYGEATENSEIMIFDQTNNKLLATTKPSGKWYSAEIKLPSEGTYTITAKASKGEESALSEALTVAVKDDAVTVEDIDLKTSGGQKVGINEDTGIPAFSVWVDSKLQGKTIEAKVTLSKDVDSLKYTFLGKEYVAIPDDSKKIWTAAISGWSGVGTQQLKIVVNDKTTFVVGELTILIDPSGYVYDKYTGKPIKDATAICEVLVNGQWVKWEAEKYGQINPQLTDEEGKYGWMVPNGTYRVKVQKDGYESYVTTEDEDPKLNSIVIPPVRDDVNIGLINIQQPQVQSSMPAEGDKAALNAPVIVIFNKSMDTSTITKDSFVVTDSKDTIVVGSFQFTEQDTKASFIPSAPLTAGETYTVILKDTIKDKADRSKTQRSLTPYSFAFTTDASKTFAYLEVESVEPADKAVDVETSSKIKVNFKESLDTDTVTKQTFKVAGNGAEILGTLKLTNSNKTIEFTPDALVAGVNYIVTLKADIKSINGNYLGQEKTYSFTTKTTAQPETPTTPSNPQTPTTPTTPTIPTTPTTPSTPQNTDTSNSSPSGSGGGGGGAPATPEAPAAPALTGGAAQNIQAAQGGTVELQNKIKVQVPANALKQNAEMKIDILKEDTAKDLLPKEAPLTLQGDIYELTAAGQSRFEKPLALSFHYDAAKVKDPSKLAAYYYHEGRKQWIFIGGEINTSSSTLSISVNHFTKFAVFENANSVKLADIENHWSKNYVNRLVGLGIINGVKEKDGSSNYLAESNVTRAQFAKMIAIALNLNIEPSTDLAFKDASSIQDWAKPYAAAVYKAGILKGSVDAKGDVNFYPEKNISRAEMAAMMGRALNWNSSQAVSFTDAKEIPAWATNYIQAAAEKKIITGYPDNTFKASNSATRGEAAAIIIRMLEELGL